MLKNIDRVARTCLGKTTVKNRTGGGDSEEIKMLRQRKRELKNELKGKKHGRNELITMYIDVQKDLRNKMLLQRIEATNHQFTKMVANTSLRLIGRQ